MSWVVQVFHPPTLDTPVAEWDSDDDTKFQTFAETALRERSGVGSLTFRVWPDDPQLPDIATGDLVRFVNDGDVIAGGVIGRIVEEYIAEDEEPGQQVQVICRGTLAVLDRARVFPAAGVGNQPVEEDRLFNFTSPQYIEDSSWDPATEIAKQSDDTTYWTLQSGPDFGAKVPNVNGQVWPAPDAYWISPSAEVGDPALDVWSPGGTSPFRRWITVTGGKYRISLTVDAQVDLFISGVPAIRTPSTVGNPTRIWEYEIALSAGAHLFAANFVANFSAGDTGGPKVLNPNGWLFALEELDSFGNVTELVAVSDDSWTVVKRPPTPPGMTVGQALGICLTEAQDRDALGWLVPTFDDDLDSAGVAWPELGDLSTKTGTSLLTFVRELVGAGYCQTRIDPDTWEWHVWAGDGDGTASGVTLTGATGDDPTTGNLVGLRRETM